MKWKIVIFFIVIFSVQAYVAQAQENQYHWEISGVVGFSGVGDYLEEDMISGFSYGGSIGYRLHRRVQLEFSYNYFSDENPSPEADMEVYTFKQDEHIYGGHVQIHFLDHPRFQPFVLTGVVVIDERHGLTTGIRMDGSLYFLRSFQFNDTHTSIVGGAGVRLFVTRHIAIRPEISIAVLGQRGMVRGSTAIGFLW